MITRFAILLFTSFIVMYCSAQTPVQVLSKLRLTDTCHWNINMDSIDVIFAYMTPLAGPTHHCCYNNFSCEITGMILYKSKKYSYYLNAGGWAHLTSEDYKYQFLLACTKKEHFKYFITTYDVSGY